MVRAAATVRHCSVLALVSDISDVAKATASMPMPTPMFADHQLHPEMAPDDPAADVISSSSQGLGLLACFSQFRYKPLRS
jgi:hypothetical protein